jgi:DNA repair exonuclease SbcCD ATPase subunit
MLELIIDKLPELKRLEQVVTTLEEEHAEAQGRVAQLVQEAAMVREDDLNRAAVALNAARKAPKAREPELRSQLESAQRELELLERRLALAGSDRSRFIQEHHEDIMRLLAQAHATEGEKVAEGARQVLADLLRYFKAEDDARALRRLVPEPVSENVGEPERTTQVWGPVGTKTFAGGPPRGDLEGALRHLISLGPATEIGGSEASPGSAA